MNRPAAKQMEWLDTLQWPAMLTNVIAAWLIASRQKVRRQFGFWCFFAGNLLWGVWGWYEHAWALAVLQICLAALNIRGVNKNETAKAEEL
jgi:hypothetical protein